MHLRSAFIAAISFVATVTAAAASETSAYVSLTASNAAACARACADDGICMAWSFRRDNQCQLSAVVLGETDPHALAAGFAARAPTHLRPRAPVVRAEPVPPPRAPTIEATAEQRPPAIESARDLVLLGGPGEGDLRLGLH